MRQTILAVAVAVAVAAALATPAAAQWAYDQRGGAFDEAATHLAMTMRETGYSLAVRCQSADDLTLVFLTEETMTDEDSDNLNLFSPLLLVRVDDEAPFELDGVTQVGETGMGIFAPAPIGVLSQINGAKRRVAVAIRVLDDTFHEIEFNARGSTSATAKLKKGCGIE